MVARTWLTTASTRTPNYAALRWAPVTLAVRAQRIIMEQPYAIALIGVGGTILGTLIGFFLNIVHERLRRNFLMKDALQSDINKALLVTVANKYPIVLAHLKDSIESNAHTLHKNKSITTFYSKWLTDPTLTLEAEFVNFLSSEQIEELKCDLEAIKL